MNFSSIKNNYGSSRPLIIQTLIGFLINISLILFTRTLFSNLDQLILLTCLWSSLDLYTKIYGRGYLNYFVCSLMLFFLKSYGWEWYLRTQSCVEIVCFLFWSAFLLTLGGGLYYSNHSWLMQIIHIILNRVQR